MDYVKINSVTTNLNLDTLIASISSYQGIVQIVHGMCEYKERYIEFIEYLNTAGYIVIAHDHRGHGESIINQEDLGYFYTNDYHDIIEDVYLVTKYIKSKYPHLPIYLLGHSMGSLIVRNYLEDYDKLIDGLIVCGSPSKNKLASVGKNICNFLAKLRGEKHHSLLVQKLFNECFNSHFNIPNEWLCSDFSVVEKYNQDSKCNFSFTVNGYKNLFYLLENTYRKTNYQCNEKLPILFIAGKEDPCIKNEKSFYQAIDNLKKRGYQNVDAILFDKMRHEILNETNKHIVYRKVVDFLNQQVKYHYIFSNGKKNFTDATKIREQVFIEEQGFIEEFDEIDNSAKHLVIYHKNKPIATGRIYQKDMLTAQIGRIAVIKTYRNLGIGSKVIQALESQALQLGYCKVVLSAQQQAKLFYEKLGYQTFGKTYYDETCLHINMEKTLCDD